jgi:HemY protein
MLRLLFLFFLLLASVILGIILTKSHGYLLIAVNHWTIETSLWFALFALMTCFVLSYCLLRFFSKLCAAPQRLHEWRMHRLNKKAQAITRQGLI